MRTIYLECAMGASGDMLMSALAGLLPDTRDFLKQLNSLPLPGISVAFVNSQRGGMTGLHAEVRIHGVTEEQHASGNIDAFESGNRHEHTHGHNHSHDHGNGDHSHSHNHKHSDGNNHYHTHSHAHESSHTHTHGHEHTHEQASGHKSGLQNIYKLIDSFAVSDKVKGDAKNVYRLIAEAEAHVHGTTVELVHFHEVGALDAVFDIVGVCMLFEMLSPDRICASPVHMGSGTVMTAHGVLPVPAPATAELLKDIPVYSEDIKGELITPTGAALLKYFTGSFGSMPSMAVSKIGYGMGTKEFRRGNYLRAFLGESDSVHEPEKQGLLPDDRIAELSCNIDDMTPEALAYAAEILRGNGALEVYTVPGQTKKNRPSFLLVCLCRPEDEPQLAQLIFKHTTTFGLRRAFIDRYTLSRRFETVNTAFGPVKVKYGEGFGIKKYKPEYDDIASIADKTGQPISKIYEEALKNLPDS